MSVPLAVVRVPQDEQVVQGRLCGKNGRYHIHEDCANDSASRKMVILSHPQSCKNRSCDASAFDSSEVQARIRIGQLFSPRLSSWAKALEQASGRQAQLMSMTQSIQHGLMSRQR